MNCPRCHALLASSATRCHVCGLEVGAEPGASSKGLPTWAWVVVASVGVLVLATCGCVGLFLFVGGARSSAIVSSTRYSPPGAPPATVAELEQALRGWSSTHDGRLPERLEDLLGPTGDDPTWIASGVLPVDAHGRPYDYRPRNQANGWSYELWSLGADGAPGGEGEDADALVASGSEER